MRMKLRFIDWTARWAHIAVQLQFEPRDLWVGVFWRFDRWKSPGTGYDRKHGKITAMPWSLHAYICIVPLVPLHIYVMRTVRHTDDPAGVVSEKAGSPGRAVVSEEERDG